jgi:hypothetical protein
VFEKLYNDYIEDLKGYSLMNTSLSHNTRDRDRYYKERTFQLCFEYAKEFEKIVNDR